ncbi:separin, partial [Clarias magur]
RRMKCLKTEEYVQRISCVKDTVVFYNELKKHVKDGLGPFGRTACDRIIRACNQRLGGGALEAELQERLVDLVELATRGYGTVAETGGQGSSLYLEKIIFHVLQKLVTHGAHAAAGRLGDFMFLRLQGASSQSEDFSVLVRNCFAVLWNGWSGVQASRLSSRQRLGGQLRAVCFRLLEETCSGSSKVPVFVEEVLSEYERAQGSLTQDDAAFLLSEFRTRFLERAPTPPALAAACEAVVKACKPLCKNGLWEEAARLVDGALEFVRERGEGLCSAAGLTLRAVRLHRDLGAGAECSRTFTDCARVLRGLPATLGVAESHALMEACQLVVWVTEAAQMKGMGGATLMASFSFWEEYQEFLMRQQESSPQLQYSLCFSLYQGFTSTYDSLHTTQDSVLKFLDRILLYCRAAAGRMMTEIRKLSNDGFFLKAVSAVNNVVYELFNRKLYEEAYGLVEIICQELSRDCPSSFPVDRVNRCFMLAVQCSRRASRLDRALDWVVRWIQVLGSRVLDHLAEPVSLWVKTKCDAARAGEDDTRLRTLRDGLGAATVNEEVCLRLLEEELRLYKEQSGDTAQERYNTLCDLLEICHEETTHTLRRASYLCDMAQVVCYRDFSAQTDCSAVDFVHEALRLLEEEPETEESSDRLRDEKAHASLWLYICTLEAKLQEAVDTERRLRAVQDGSKTAADLEPVPTNDLEYEDKQKVQESQLVYDGLRFNLSEHNKRTEPLEECLSLWGTLLKDASVPAVRDPKHTASSILIMAALYTLMGKTLQALQSYRLAASLLRLLGDVQNSAGASLHAAKLLLDLGCPHLAQVQLDQTECLTANISSEGANVVSVTNTLLRAQLYYTLGEVEAGVQGVCEVLRETALHHSKGWYMLKARALQTASAFLSLDTGTLHTHLRQTIVQHGVKTPDTAQYEALKLLCSLVMMLLGHGFYGAPGLNTDTRFIDQGDSVVFKWLLLSEVLLCSERMVRLRSASGAAHEAKAQCLEALKLATKLHTLSHCAELLVLKAELELMKGAGEAGVLDLEQVRHLLDLCTDFGEQQQLKSEVKLKPRKGRPAVSAPAPELQEDDEEDDTLGLLSSRSLGREAVEGLSGAGQDSSPPLKPKRQRMLSCLSHAESCSCPCCTEPGLARVSVLWALAQADAHSEVQNSRSLRHIARLRCRHIGAKLQARLAALMPVKPVEKPRMLQTEVVRARLSAVLTHLCRGLADAGKAGALWEEMEAGLEAVEPRGALFPELGHLKAALLGAKAVACCLALAGKKRCSTDELFSSAWGWTPPAAPKTKAQVKPRGKNSSGDGPLQATAPSAKNLTENKQEVCVDPGSKKVTIASSKKTKSSAPKISITNPGAVFRTPRASRTPRPRAASAMTPAGTDLSAFDFTTEVPDITVSSTPLPAAKATPGRRCGVTRSKDVPKGSFQVFEDASPLQDKPVPVPDAPKRTKRSRFKVEFSDESDAEPAEVPKTKSHDKRAVPSAPKPVSKASLSRAPEQDRPRRTRTAKKSTALCTSGASSEEETQPPRRGRGRKAASVGDVDKPERMRMIREDEDEGGLEISLEDLHESDSELVNTVGVADGPGADCEVLRRDLLADPTRDCVQELRSSGQTGLTLPHTHATPDELSVDGIRSLLTTSWLLLHHFPNSSLYPHMCSLLAQSLGTSDPVTTAMLHAESLGVSSRHHMTRYLANRMRKLKKSSGDVAESLSGLSLDESPSQTQTSSLSVLESVYSFTCTQPEQFPHTHCTEFTQQLQHLPSGVTVCLLSLVGTRPGEIGSTVLITRLERDSAPITMRIPTAQTRRAMAVLLEEMEAVLQGQKTVSAVTDKADWWEGRKSLDARVQKLLEEMEEALGVWRTLLLPMTSDPELSVQVKPLAWSARGSRLTADVLKVILSAAPLLSASDLQSLSEGACLQDGDFLKLLQKSVCELSGRAEPQGHTLLILDKYLQKLPWENISCLKPRSVTRMPSLHTVLGHGLLQAADPDCVLSRGVDPQQVYFVLNPDGNLPETEKRFRDWFTGERAWQGVCGAPPDPDQLQDAVSTKDLYIYVGHGAGARFLDTQRLLRGNVRAVSLLLGCSSAALSVQGNMEGNGIVLSYLTAGCPLVLGNLWDVTDRDLDRFTSALLQSWLSSGSGSSLLQHLVQSRDSTHLKHMIGAAPVAPDQANENISRFERRITRLRKHHDECARRHSARQKAKGTSSVCPPMPSQAPDDQVRSPLKQDILVVQQICKERSLADSKENPDSSASPDVPELPAKQLLSTEKPVDTDSDADTIILERTSSSASPRASDVPELKRTDSVFLTKTSLNFSSTSYESSIDSEDEYVPNSETDSEESESLSHNIDASSSSVNAEKECSPLGEKVNVETEVSESEDEESENETPEKHRQSSLTSIGLQSPDPQSRGIVSWQHIFKSSLFSIY